MNIIEKQFFICGINIFCMGIYFTFFASFKFFLMVCVCVSFFFLLFFISFLFLVYSTELLLFFYYIYLYIPLYYFFAFVLFYSLWNFFIDWSRLFFFFSSDFEIHFFEIIYVYLPNIIQNRVSSILCIFMLYDVT